MQIGGSDQWGNILSGTELVRKVCKATVHGITTPLLVTPDGKKFGKTEGNAVWASNTSEDLLAVYQYLLNQPDSMAEDLLLRLTFLPEAAVAEAMAIQNAKPESSHAKLLLATEVLSYITGSRAKAEGVRNYSKYFNLDLEALVSRLYGLRLESLLRRSLQSSVMFSTL